MIWDWSVIAIRSNNIYLSLKGKARSRPALQKEEKRTWKFCFVSSLVDVATPLATRIAHEGAGECSSLTPVEVTDNLQLVPKSTRLGGLFMPKDLWSLCKWKYSSNSEYCWLSVLSSSHSWGTAVYHAACLYGRDFKWFALLQLVTVFEVVTV